MKLLIATRNKNKLEEISMIFRFPAVEFVSALDFPDLPEVEEDGRTFEANAVKKAVTLAVITGLWTMADDSGLEVYELGGRPGVYSARFAGEPPDHKANNEKLLRLLSGKEERGARFRCVLAFAGPGGKAQVVDGVCEGTIAESLRGESGFGYDPLFVPNGQTQTFAELGLSVKNKMSHRAYALRKARETWGHIFEGAPADWPEK